MFLAIRIRPSLYLASVFALALATPASAGDLSLQVESRSQSLSILEPDVVEVTYHLVNRSEKIITAWYFGCISVSQLGVGSLTYTAADAYYASASLEPSEGVAGDHEAPLAPGQRTIKKVTFRPEQQDGPYAARSCEPILVIFADATFEGDSKLANRAFERRAQDAIQAFRAHAHLARELNNGAKLMEVVARLIEEQPRSSGLGLSSLQTFQEMVGKGERPAEAASILAELRAFYDAVMPNLPKEWQESVERELNP